MSRLRRDIGNTAMGWLVILRVLAGVYWFYFGVQKWFNYAWVRGMLTQASLNNRIPIYGELLRNFIVPNWEFITILQTVAETLVGLGLILGLLSRVMSSCGSAGVL